MFADVMHIVRLDSYCHCASLELYQWFPEKTCYMFFPLQIELSLIQMFFFSGFVLFL